MVTFFSFSFFFFGTGYYSALLLSIFAVRITFTEKSFKIIKKKNLRAVESISSRWGPTRVRFG